MMFTNFQKTIKEPIEFKGIGLHNGIKVNMSLNPAEADSGIRFKRTDIGNAKNIIDANFKNGWTTTCRCKDDGHGT